MAKQRFNVKLMADAIIELDDAVIAAVDNDWRDQFYNLVTSQQVAKHVAYNLIVNNAKLSQLDGWADQPDENAKLITQEWEFVDD